MVKIYFSYFDHQLSTAQLDHYLAILPEMMRQQVMHYQRWEDRQSSLFGRLLLQRALREQKTGLNLEHLQFTKYGKPFLDGNVSFSLAHSGAYVLCAISNSHRVGVDVEKIRTGIDVDEFKNQFTSEEWNDILTVTNKLQAFYTLWTSKEAVMKADGRGVSIIDQTKISAGIGYTPDGRWLIREIILDKNYVARLAMSDPLTEPIILEKISFQ